MSIFRKSEDPWDRKPGKHSPEPREPRESPIHTLKTWNEDRKARAKEREEAKRLPPEKCPWCGRDMEQGFLDGGRDKVRWYPGIYRVDPLRGLDSTGRIDVQDEGGFWGGLYKTTWLCRACGKAVFDMPDPPADPFAAQAEDNDTKEEETSEE